MKKGSYVNFLPVYGCISTGIIYVGVGAIAILSFLKIKHGGADESSLLAFLNHYFAGKIVFWLILAGTVSYVAWRIFESFKDPYGYGKGLKGIATRSGIAMSTLPDILIALTALKITGGHSDVQINGQPVAERHMVASILRTDPGDKVVIAIGIIICIAALAQFLYGITRGYRERLDLDGFSRGKQQLTHSLAWTGYFARAVIVGIIGFFFIKAGILDSPQYIVNTDKAFDFIGDHVGHLYFILVAIATICYGLFMFILGTAYDVDKD